MNTMQENGIICQNVTISGEELTDLLTGALIATDKGRNAHPKMAGIYLSAKGNTFIVRGTDRYRLVQGVTKSIREVTDFDTGELYECFIPNEQVKNILANIKGVSVVRIVREGLLLTIHGVNIVSFSLFDHELPPFESVISKVQGEPVPVTSICLNPKFAGEFAKVPGNGARLQFYGDKLPIKFEIKHDLIEWTCLLMPMREI